MVHTFTQPNQALGSRATDSERGFTLVELMVVVAIIAVIAGIIIPNYVHARRQAVVSNTQANMKQVATALELYFADHQDYPAGSKVNVTPALFGGAANAYLNATPENGHQDYVYTYGGGTGAAPTYDIEDPVTYDAPSVINVSLGPNATDTQRTCGDTNTCTRLHYDPRYGIYGLNQ
jgi:prepilin-type N-terminal cleavage/methylation domain-containing protein